jgi:3-hydroxymyristoyl/3-hydroxydecanoyl-(acyl carrier protein) dehydratase
MVTKKQLAFGLFSGWTGGFFLCHFLNHPFHLGALWYAAASIVLAALLMLAFHKQARRWFS